MRGIIASAAIMALSGCSTLAGVLPTIRVPIPVPCDPPVIERPAMPVDNLTGDEDIFVISRALWAEVMVRDGYEGRLRAAVDGCRKEPEKK